MAERAAVVIGVNNYDAMPVLASPVDGAERFARLLTQQLIGGAALYDVKLLTGAGRKKVSYNQVESAIDRFIKPPIRYRVLVVYFSGHGLWQARSDQWMLSKAPQRTGDAINLLKAVEMAKYCGIPNVVFVSDACRSLPEDVGQMQLDGLSGFTSYDVGGRNSAKVDVFRATSRAKAAYEAVLDGRPQSMLTSALLSAYDNPPRKILRTINAGGKRIRIVPNRLLEDFLQARVDGLLRRVNVALAQDIEAEVPSGDDVYIACPATADRTSAAWVREVASPTPDLSKALDEAESDESPPIKRRRPRAISQRRRSLPQLASELSRQPVLREDGSLQPVPEALQQEFASNLPSDAVTHFESGSGFALSGATVRRAFTMAPDAGFTRAEPLPAREDGEATPGSLVRVWIGNPPAGGMPVTVATVAIELEDGRSLALAAIAGYIGHCTIGADGLGHISYVPSKVSSRPPFLWDVYQSRREKLDALRARAAVAANHGRFSSATADAAWNLANELREEKAIDPSLGLYAVYAYSQAGDDAQVRDVLDYMQRDGNLLFDAVMLARHPADPPPARSFVPACPMLTQGWNLVGPRGMELPPVFDRAEAWLTGSLWTTFRPGFADRLFDAASKGELICGCS